MTRELIWAIVLVGFVVVIVLGILAWRRRARGQAGLDSVEAVPADLGAELLSDDLLYVATTRAGDPYDRIHVAGLGFRARGTVTVHARGVLLELAGSPARWIAAEALRGAGRATWTIDRVVERDGLVLLGWTLAGDDVDTYLRSEEPAALLAALHEIAPALADAPTPADTATAAQPADAVSAPAPKESA
ncbi:hypothetical protein GCM10027515_21460 [Schumannella luteola]|uniref:PH domain-containing protein n=1 Tax=Schumannella luteola TaxID=472059 RepID=A0A852YLI2_9MICO|nr:hypothetical protein [Schumannella luteola]NYH00059.1 hypothetical protein [Schumannella luteola]TPX06615.1 hypothetical protein FJ656_00240 [Schumannella luteola]